MSLDYDDLESRLRSDGGFSVDPRTGKSPTDGIMAANFGAERVTNNVATSADIEAFNNDHAHDLAQPDAYLGGWNFGENPERTALDASRRFTRADEAHEFARRNAQIATYDLGADHERFVHYGPAVSPAGMGLEEHRAATAKKNAAWRGTVRQHLIERGRQPSSMDEVQAAGKRIGEAVYNAEQLSNRLGQR